ncbi:bifunctional diguanylate cyclase/phosphodiesterase [Alkalibacter rhizosphaerae]|uniref:Bifunctional diguanylate cyclase/phosphodiesterase n=1 Tax=Alkalibacter rhizosphaerae TaxID=2815577 RepID=A0A974XD31_9FIRM|nr:bifunctional diguanylate cyclase/phosphodiesterase [Alkalibacter rhizosphaerae]QSX07617.1 bifunctional diguanylate cyclase/phosphodiesterase [Alkalibacter rhizosphaerae]
MSRKIQKKGEPKAVDIRAFVAPFILLVLIYGMLTASSITNQVNRMYESLQENSVRLTRSYSQGLVYASKAQDTFQEFLEEKLLVAGKMILQESTSHTNEELMEFSKNLDVDIIHLYDETGTIIKSNTGEYLGWVAPADHPVHRFMESDATDLVEEIRADTVSGILYKYGYYRHPSGNFVQIGVLAEKLETFADGFQMQNLLKDIKDDGHVQEACFIGPENRILASTRVSNVGLEIQDPFVIQELGKEEETGFETEDFQGNGYRVLVPVEKEGDRIGTLSLLYSTEAFRLATKETITSEIAMLLLIILSLGIVFGLVYDKSKQNMEMAYYDPLTGLPNADYMKEFLEQQVRQETGRNRAILLLNSRNFKTINNTYGYQFGDELLKESAKEITKLVGDRGILFRFNADRFVLYVEGYEEKRALIDLAKEISEIFNQPFSQNVDRRYLNAEVGILELDENTDSADELLRKASLALDSVRTQAGASIMFYTRIIEKEAKRVEIIEHALEQALIHDDENTLYAMFQPQLDLKTDRITGVEVLARLDTKELGPVSPAEFIPIAEKKKLIHPLGVHILKKACCLAAACKDAGYEDIRFSVNVSGIQLLRRDFLKIVLMTIQEAAIPNSMLELEITESIFLDNFLLINDRLKELQKRNIQIALDDFGTGYSSFARLKEIRIDTVKLDKFFIDNIHREEEEDLISSDIISMAHRLGLKVVAEGVETEEQMGYLKDHHCDAIQGYYFSKPVHQEDLLELIGEHNKKDEKKS